MTGEKPWFMTSCITMSILVIGLYAITGLSGLQLATGSHYSTPIWIPSGIALGAALICGYRILPAIFIGSLFVNYQITMQDPSVINLGFPLLIGLIIATGATLQALIGYLLIQHKIGLHNALYEPTDILEFAFYSGVVSSLVNATTSNTALYLLGVLPDSQFLTSWATWYTGDSIGILLFTPVFLILFGSPAEIWRSRIIPVLLPLCISFLIVSISYIYFRVSMNEINQLWFFLTCGFLFCVLINITLFITNGQKSLMRLEMNEILRSAGESIYGVNTEEKIIFANPAAEKMWNYPENGLIGKSIHEFINYLEPADPGTHDQDCPIYAAIKHNKTSNITNTLLIRNDGSSFWVEYTCTPLVLSGKTRGAVIVANDISQHRESEFHLERLAHHDILTGFPNRFSFIETLSNSINHQVDNNTKMAVCLLDIDNFKNVNDNLGHAAGDLALQKLSLIIANQLGPNDYFARLGGDEFGIILYNRSKSEIDELIYRLINMASQPIEIKSTIINLYMSIGISIYPVGGLTADDLIKNADIAMYRAKEAGKNTYAYFNEELNEAITRLHLLESELRNAIYKNELTLYYQPQIEISTGKLSGLEVLLRWESPVLGSVSPGEFIPIAERNGMIHPIGVFVLQQLAEEYKSIFSVLKKSIKIAINVSVMQFNDTRFYNNLVKILDEEEGLRNILILELTETAFMSNPKRTIDLMRKINKLGIHFSLDDFGMNYSSMRYLKSLPISQLKIDYYFIKDITMDNNDLAIVNTIIQLSQGMGFPAIAEGVETKAQLDLLVKIGCKYVQGYYYYRPMPLNQLLAMIKNKAC